MAKGETSADPIRNHEMGTVQQPEGDLTAPNYLTMQRNGKDARRAKNRVARNSRKRNARRRKARRQ